MGRHHFLAKLQSLGCLFLNAEPRQKESKYNSTGDLLLWRLGEDLGVVWILNRGGHCQALIRVLGLLFWFKSQSLCTEPVEKWAEWGKGWSKTDLADSLEKKK